MAFLFSSICPCTVALWQWSDVLWLVCKSGSPFVQFSFYIPAQEEQLECGSSLPDCSTVTCFISSGCVMHTCILRNACTCVQKQHSPLHRGFLSRRFFAVSHFHLKRQISYSYPVLAAAMSAHWHKMPLFFPTAARHTYSRVVANCSVWALNWFPLHYPVIGQLMLREAREM